MDFNNSFSIYEDKNKLSVLFWLRKVKKSRKTGLIPLYCRITMNGIRATQTGFSTNAFIKEADWNNKLQIITADTEEAELQNERLQRMKLDIMRVAATFELANKPFTALDVQAEYLGKTLAPHVYTLGELVKDWEELVRKKVDVNDKRPRTLISHLDYNKKVLDYFGDTKTLESFKESDWELFRLHLRSSIITKGKSKGQSLSINTTAKVMGHLNALFMHAHKLGWLPRRLFEYEHAPRVKPQKLSLTTSELESLRIYTTKNVQVRTAVDIFLFLASTGFSYSDYCELTSENISVRNGREYIIKEYREKSPSMNRYGKSIVPILEEARFFFERYETPEKFPKPDSHDVNDALKIAWEKLGISPRITLKNARQTFINYARNVLGLPEGTIATIVGHASVRTTEESYLTRGIETVENDLKRTNL